MRVRVVVYNVRGFRDGFERLVRLVGHFEPDLVLLNETGSRWRLRRFANALGMELAADPSSSSIASAASKGVPGSPHVAR
jgi:hypothetical protein